MPAVAFKCLSRADVVSELNFAKHAVKYSLCQPRIRLSVVVGV